MFRNYLYSVTDKALFDALNQSKISATELRDLFLSRGILVSKDTKREFLAKEFSKYNHDYYDHIKIAEALGTTPRREKRTSLFISSDIDLSTIEEAAEALKVKITKDQDLCQLTHKDDGTFEIDITYQTTDYNKSEFRQIVQKSAIIEIEEVDGGFIVRRPYNDHVKDYEESLLSNIEDNLEEDEDLKTEEISLLNIEDKELRTRFFTKLISSIPGHKQKDVSDVYVYHPKHSAFDSGDDGEPDSGVHITKASLKGEGVLASEELDALYDKGFYIWKIRWSMIDSSVDTDIFEFECQFGNPVDCTGFSHISKGVRRYKSQGVHNKNPSSLTKIEEKKYTKLIERTARETMQELELKAQEDQTDGAPENKVESDQDKKVAEAN